MKQLLLCIVLAVGASGQNVPINADAAAAAWRTGGNWNGRLWKNLRAVGEGAQNAFVMGYTNAVQDTVFGIGAATKVDYSPILKLLSPSSLTIAEIVTALNVFYDVPENGPIAIVGAMKVIAQRTSSGADDAAIQKATADLRAASTK